MNLAIWIPEWVERLGWVLLHFVWQGLLIGVVSWMGMIFLKKSSAQSRYLLLCAALLSCILTPCITWIILANKSHRNTPVANLSSESIQTNVTSGSTLTTTEITSTGSVQGFSHSSGWTLKNLESLVAPRLPYLVTIWGVGVIFLSLRLLYGWIQLRRLFASGVPVADRTWGERLHLLSEKMGIRGPITLLESILIEVPTVIGWMQPVILVPVTFLTGLPSDQIEAILAHELAHIQRHDYFVNLIQIAVETLLFYHPVVWWISKSIREERENCCDDIALRVVGDKAVYVSALAALEESRSLPMAITMSVAGGSLLQRIKRIIGVGGGKDSSWLVLAALLMLAVAASAGMWEAKHHGQAEKMASKVSDGATNSVAPRKEIEVEAQIYVGTQSDLEKAFIPPKGFGNAFKIYMHAARLCGVSTSEQTQSLVGNLKKQRGVFLISAPKVTLSSDSKATVSADFSHASLGDISPSTLNGTFQLDAQPTLGPDGQTIDLNYSVMLKRQGKAWSVDTDGITLWDGQTALMSGGMPGDGNLCEAILITAKVVNPKNQPSNRNPAGLLKVTCTDESGAPVAGASVKAEWPDHSTNLTTDSNGVASITLPDGRLPYLSARVQKEGFVPKIIEWRLDQPSFQLPGEFFLNMEKAQSIGGFVKNEEGQPVENAKVVLIIRGSSMGVSQQVFNDLWERRVTTDKEGKWHFDEAPSDLHSLSVTLEHPDYISNERIDPLPSDDDFKQQKAVLIAHNGVPVDGTVTDEKGQPISGVDVTFGEAGSDSASYPSTKTDSKGHFHFNGLSIKKSYIAPILTFTSADHAPVMATLDQGSGAQSLKVTMNSGKKLQIRFVDKQGQPVRGVTLCPDTWQGHRPFGCFRFESDTYGMVVWKHAPEGPITYALLADSYLNESPTLQPSDEVQTYQLKRPTAISGRVLDAVTQKPITDYQLIPGMYFPEPNIDWIGWERLGVRQFRTDSYHYVFDRAAVMRSSPPTEGFHRIRIEAPGYEPGVSRPIANNEDSVTLDFALKPESAIHGLVTAADGSPVHNAQIVVAGYGNASRIHDGMFTDLSRQQVVTTDENGKYELPAQEEDYPIAIIQPDKGYFTTTYKELKAAPNVKLLSWGEISLTRADTGDTNRSYYVSCWKKEGPPYHAKQIFFDDDRPNTVQGNPVIFKHLTAGPVWLGIQHGLPNEGSVVQVENGKTTKVDLKTGKTGIIEPDGTIRDQGNPSAQVLGKFFPNIATTEKKGGEATNPEVKSPDASLTKTLSVQVIDQQGKPIQGASVKPTGFRTKVDHGSWWGIRPQDEHLFASGTTDAQGKISVSFPSHAGDELTTGTVIVLVQHPEACSAEVEINIDEPKPVMLVRGTKVILSAQPLPGVSFSRIEADIVDDERQARLQKWTHAPDGKSVSAHLPDGNDLVRLVGMTPQGKIYFSDSVPFSLLAKPEGGKTLQSGDSELKKSFVMHEGGMVKGALDSSVPRPVKGGWIVGCVSSQLPDHGNSLINTWWTSSDVAEDGSFALTNLPAGTLEIVAGCNGYVSKDESTRMFAGIHQARLIGLDRDQQLSIPMEPTGEVRVEVQTPDGKPLSGATVGFSPNQSMGNGNGLLGARFNSAEMLSHQETDSATPAKQQPPSNPFYAKTDSSGVATIKGLPVGAQHFSVISDSYYMPYEILPPPNVPRRRQTASVEGNSTVTVSVKMTPKGIPSVSDAMPVVKPNPLPHPLQDTNASTISGTTNQTIASQSLGKSGSEYQDKLTPERVASLTAPVKADPKERILVEISDVGKAELSTSTKEDVTMGHSDDFIYPKRYDPPQKSTSTNSPTVTPSFPKDFKNEKLGLKIQLHAERVGSVIALYGVVERTEFKGFINNTAGELQGPIVDKPSGEILTTNTINQPMFQKDISSFYLTAIPGKSYEVPFFQGKDYQGKKAETHTIKITLQ